MSITYDKYYQTENLFGEPYPELIAYFSQFKRKGKVLDLGCGQGRDAIALARMGYWVVGLDNSQVGLDQMNKVSHEEQLKLEGLEEDIFSFDQFYDFNFILLDNMFHFAKKDKERELNLLKTISENKKRTCKIVIFIQDSGTKVITLKNAVIHLEKLKILVEEKFKFAYLDQETGNAITTGYSMIVCM